ncbi:unnamed protein product [Nippostrongylus brasiliensis]|uniref:GRANULINS domain-containing protein n=1 Tax=Nippostrongylus brasiliensis TaxID=27835 RepID=A0A0N4YLL5_NIPBR|nr:hypothetical protein Q1695_004154 [Nippostrongylus brasiliensis]VDL81731.1 unnamed protein product [Nippostrongylus brasiliensis]
MRRIVFVTLFLRLYNVDTRLTCGVEVFTSNVMEVIVKLDCPDLLVKHQKCCMAHGKCYKKGKPWKRCDRMYCRCVFRIAGRAGGTCQVIGESFCTLVSTTGRFFYTFIDDGL